MSVDIDNQQPATSNIIIYSWWCHKCQQSHYTPCCPYDKTDYELMGMAKYGVPGICPVCWRPMWEHGMTMEYGR